MRGVLDPENGIGRGLVEVIAQAAELDFIPGEKFSIFEETTRRAFLRCEALRNDRDLDRYNNGVTFIIL